jgi:NADH-quinone oxidoreductase subunit N
MVVAVILLVVNYFIRQKSNKMVVDLKKSSAYECGFDTFSETFSHSIDVQFFLVSIMFLIFDVELALMFPWAIDFDNVTIFSFWVMILFVAIVTLGFAYEWRKGALNWYKVPSLAQRKSFILLLPIWVVEITAPVNFLSFLYYLEHFAAEIVIIIFVVIALLFALSNKNNIIPALLNTYVANIISLGFTIALIILLTTYTKSTVFIVEDYFINDRYVTLAKIFLIFTVMVITYLSKCFLWRNKIFVWELPIFFALGTFFMLLLISAHNLISLFLTLEGLSLCLYILAGYDSNRRTSSEAAIKYFTMGAMSAGCLLFGIVSIYAVTGSTALVDLSYWSGQAFTETRYFVYGLGSLLIFYGLLFKIGAWPLHQWVPDVYEGAPSVVTAFFTICVKFSVVIVLVRLIPNLCIWMPLVLLTALGSLIVGVAGSLETNKIKRFLAYTAINQVGLILLGVYSGSIVATLFYVFTYFLATLAFFIIFISTTSITNKYSQEELVYISDFSNFAYYNPVPAILLSIIFFSMAGLPPFVTAVGKWLIFVKLAELGYYILFFVVVLITILSIYYYVRIIKSLFFELPVGKGKQRVFVCWIKGVLQAVLFSIILFLSAGSVFVFLWLTGADLILVQTLIGYVA